MLDKKVVESLARIAKAQGLTVSDALNQAAKDYIVAAVAEGKAGGTDAE